MLDRSGPYSGSTRDLRPQPADISNSHFWLMRRELPLHSRTFDWPQSLQMTALNSDNAYDAHQLLMLGRQHGGGRVADFKGWLDAFEHDPEFDRELCFVVSDALGVVAIAHCWTSAFIRNLAVHPRARHQGVGLALLNQVFIAFCKRGEGQVDLKVMESNLTARRLYERAGMRYILRAKLDPRQ